MKVIKIGGGCLRDSSSLSSVGDIIAREKQDTVIVVSAIFGMTDLLSESLERIVASEKAIGGVIQKVRNAHVSLIAKSFEDMRVGDATKKHISDKISELERLLYGIAYTGEVTDRTRAFILSFGERLSCCLVAGYLESRGIPARGLDADKAGLITDESFENATAFISETERNLRRTILPLLKKGIKPVITGYFGRTRDGRITTFGKNGSDYSAAVITRCLGASVLEIWKDVDGFMSADPLIVESARHIDALSYYEAAELSYFGAKILHPRTVEPLVETDIPLSIRNIREPKNPGTRIALRGFRKKNVLKSVTYNNDISVLKIKGAGVGYKPGIISEMSNRLSGLKINIYSIITSQTCINLLLGKEDLEKSYEAVEELSGGVIEKIECVKNIALVAVVGEGLLRTQGLAARVFGAVARQNVNVEMISAGASEVAYYFIVDRRDVIKTVNAIHDEFLLEEGAA